MMILDYIEKIFKILIPIVLAQHSNAILYPSMNNEDYQRIK